MTTEQIIVMLTVVPTVLAQGIYLFIDARRRGYAAWLWGLWGLMNAPMPLFVYLFVQRKIHRSWRKPK